MKRLIVSRHGVNNRDSAIVYIDGEVLEGANHPRLVEDYLANHQEKTINAIKEFGLIANWEENKINDMIDMYQKKGKLMHGFLSQFNEWNRLEGNKILKEIDELSVGFAHKDGYQIYVESESLVNVDFNTVVQAIKAKFPNCEIYDDDKNQNEKVAYLFSDVMLFSPVPKEWENKQYFKDYFKIKNKQPNDKNKNKDKKNQDMFNLLNGGLKMSRLYRIAITIGDSAPRGVLPIAPPYGAPDSYSGYLNQNPENKYIKRLRGQEPKDKSPKTFQDFLNEYLEDDNFTIKPGK